MFILVYDYKLHYYNILCYLLLEMEMLLSWHKACIHTGSNQITLCYVTKLLFHVQLHSVMSAPLLLFFCVWTSCFILKSVFSP